MPTVEAKVFVEGVSLETVWNVVADMEQYPKSMDDVLEVRFLDHDGARATSTWRVLLNGSELTWVEEDIFEPMRSIRFQQLEGDLEDLHGEWRLEQQGDGVTVTLRTHFDIGIPSLAEVLDPIGIQAIRANSRQMLKSIGKNARASGSADSCEQRSA